MFSKIIYLLLCFELQFFRLSLPRIIIPRCSFSRMSFSRLVFSESVLFHICPAQNCPFPFVFIQRCQYSGVSFQEVFFFWFPCSKLSFFRIVLFSIVLSRKVSLQMSPVQNCRCFWCLLSRTVIPVASLPDSSFLFFSSPDIFFFGSFLLKPALFRIVLFQISGRNVSIERFFMFHHMICSLSYILRVSIYHIWSHNFHLATLFGVEHVWLDLAPFRYIIIDTLWIFVFLWFMYDLCGKKHDLFNKKHENHQTSVFRLSASWQLFLA